MKREGIVYVGSYHVIIVLVHTLSSVFYLLQPPELRKPPKPSSTQSDTFL